VSALIWRIAAPGIIIVSGGGIVAVITLGYIRTQTIELGKQTEELTRQTGAIGEQNVLIAQQNAYFREQNTNLLV
jgi:hypothetical protein